MSELSADSVYIHTQLRDQCRWLTDRWLVDGFRWYGGEIQLDYLTGFVWHLLWCPGAAHNQSILMCVMIHSLHKPVLSCGREMLVNLQSACLIKAHHVITKGTGSSGLNRISEAGTAWEVCVCVFSWVEALSFFAIAAWGRDSCFQSSESASRMFVCMFAMFCSVIRHALSHYKKTHWIEI